MQRDFANTGGNVTFRTSGGIVEVRRSAESLDGSPVQQGGGALARLTPSRQKLEIPVLGLPDTEGDYDIKEITRGELNERTSIRTRFLKQSYNCVMLKAWLAVFEDPEFEMTSFKRHRKSLL